MVFTMSCLLPLQTKAQSIVVDPTNIAMETSNFSSELEQMLVQTFHLNMESETVQKMLKGLKKAQEAMTTVSTWVGKVENLKEFYTMTERSINLLAYGKEVIMDDEWWDASAKLNYLTSLIQMTNYNVQRGGEIIMEFTPGSTTAGNMSDAQRLERMDNAKDEMSANIVATENYINQMQWEKSQDIKEELLNDMYSSALYFNY